MLKVVLLVAYAMIIFFWILLLLVLIVSFFFLMFLTIDLVLSFIHSSCYPVNCFISINESFISDWIFFMLLRSPLSSLGILITSVLNSASDRLLISTLFSSFSRVLICFFVWAMFLFSSF